MTDEPGSAGPGTRTPIPYARLLTCRTIVGQALVAFAAYWLVTLAVVWLPAYLTKGGGFTSTETGWIVTLPALANIVLVPGVCALSEWLKRRGLSSRTARGGPACVGLFAAGLLAFALPLVSGVILPIVCVALAFSLGSPIFSLGRVMVAEVTPAEQRGSMLSISNAVATLAGPLAPVLMGVVVDTGTNAVAGFGTGFMLTGAGIAIVAVIAMFLIDPDADRARLASAPGKQDRLEADIAEAGGRFSVCLRSGTDLGAIGQLLQLAGHVAAYSVMGPPAVRGSQHDADGAHPPPI